MSHANLPFFCPHKIRLTRIPEYVVRGIKSLDFPSPRQCRTFVKADRTPPRLCQRHGKAVEPSMIHGETYRDRPHGDEVKNFKKGKKSKFIQASKTDDEIRRANSKIPHVILPSKSGQATGKTIPVNKNMRESLGGKTSDGASSSPKNRVNHIEPLKPLETVLHIPPTETVEEQNSTKSSYLVAPPYVHHFDTYTLVQQVHSGGFTVEQSITTMKAVRALLAMNLGVAKASLVSKSDVENVRHSVPSFHSPVTNILLILGAKETYLFQAASSELKTEIQSMRRKNEEAMRRERTQLQNEVDILNQKLSQELLALKEELKGMFDDRKMSVRMDQSTMESKIQELNYKITVMLNSDSKSEVEGLRWVLTRRSVMGILFMAFMVLTSLRYASYKSRENENRRKKESHTKSNERDKILPAQGAAEILAAS